MAEQPDLIGRDMAPDKSTTWVGIGASAGGLRALRTLVANLPKDENAVYVIVQHLSPHHDSTLSALIARETDLNVKEIVDRTQPQTNTIYVAPPNTDVGIKNGRLRLRAPATNAAAPKPSVNRFFRSMAENLASRAIGVILSGTGSDGAYGVQAIRAAGGIAIAQSLDTAEYSGMPEAAMETGCIDAILPPAEIAKRFLSLTKVPNGTDPSDMDEDVLNDGYARLLELIEERTHVNFMGYKVATIRRRIDRRIATLELPTFQAYLDHVETHPQEIMAIFRDMMISVTSFFRDPEEYAALEKNVRPIVEQRGERGLRVWIPGCATGEEAYSVAIILVELLGGVGALDTRPLQIFATDIDTDALTRARRGHFPDAIMDTVPEELREKYFVRQGAGYTINSAVRDCIVFTQHNVIQDPPFSNVDLVTGLLRFIGNSTRHLPRKSWH